jgi:hypothetical protein
LGPINAWIEPVSILRSTLSTAENPLKVLERPEVSRITLFKFLVPGGPVYRETLA